MRKQFIPRGTVIYVGGFEFKLLEDAKAIGNGDITKIPIRNKFTSDANAQFKSSSSRSNVAASRHSGRKSVWGSLSSLKKMKPVPRRKKKK